tara:strand:+ start:700 stop:831 length:132 start_codon:yes stop_codon:yes gene_type:complete
MKKEYIFTLQGKLTEKQKELIFDKLYKIAVKYNLGLDDYETEY